VKGLARRNTHVKYKSPTTYQSKVITRTTVFEKVKLPNSKVRRSRHQIKGFARRYTYEI
jgi:hypothetical protein